MEKVDLKRIKRLRAQYGSAARPRTTDLRLVAASLKARSQELTRRTTELKLDQRHAASADGQAAREAYTRAFRREG